MLTTSGYTSAICTPDPTALDMFEFYCPHCEHRLKVPEQYLGVSGRCNQCQGAITPLAPVTPAAPVPGEGKSDAWYAARRRHFAHCFADYEAACAKYGRPVAHGHWESALSRAKEADASRQKELYLQAIVMGCPWPFPYARMAKIYAREGDYKSAYNICVRYFEQEQWKTPQWARSSGELLDTMEKLQRKLRAA